MDISETYIKMCREANKILPENSVDGVKRKPVEPWDYWYMQAGDLDVFNVMVVTLLPGQGPSVREHDGYKLLFPLYRQDQLQEMVAQGGKLPVWKVEEWFHNWIPRGSRPESFEQLWLAFVMEEKHGKAWNGETWAPTTSA